MDDDVIVRREERGLISVLTMEYRPYNLLGPTLIGAIAAEVTAAQEAGSRAIVLRSGLRHFSAGADVALFGSRIEEGGRSQGAINGVDFLKLLELLPIPIACRRDARQGDLDARAAPRRGHLRALGSR